MCGVLVVIAGHQMTIDQHLGHGYNGIEKLDQSSLQRFGDLVRCLENMFFKGWKLM